MASAACGCGLPPCSMKPWSSTAWSSPALHAAPSRSSRPFRAKACEQTLAPHQLRHGARVDLLERRLGLLVHAQVHGKVVRAQALEVERDAQAVRGAAAEKAVELHGGGLPGLIRAGPR